MDDDFFAYVVLGSIVVALLLLLIGSIVSTSPRRGVSDWVMIGGMSVSFLGILGFLFLLFVVEPMRYSRGNYEFWESIFMAVGFSIPGGVVVFGGGFLLSRFEAKRRASQLELFLQGLHPQAGMGPRAGGGPPAIPGPPPPTGPTA